MRSERPSRGATEWPWHRPIFPGLDDPSIVGAGAFHDRVRQGNGWDHSALATRTIGSLHDCGVSWLVQPRLDSQVSVEQGKRQSEDMDPADLTKREIGTRALGH